MSTLLRLVGVKLLCGRNLHGFVDPRWFWQRRGDRCLANKTFGVNGVGCLKHMGALNLDTFGVAEVDGGRGVEAQARVSVLVVVPREETLAEHAAIFDGAEPSRKLWAVLESLEVRL